MKLYVFKGFGYAVKPSKLGARFTNDAKVEKKQVVREANKARITKSMLRNEYKHQIKINN